VKPSGRSVLITGGSGCLGAWVARLLIEDGDQPVIFHRGADIHRLEWVLSRRQLAAVRYVRGDVSVLADVEEALSGHGVDAVIHAAALQIPFCAADPVAGAMVNVVGTINVFEAVKRLAGRVPGVVYAGSDAMYDSSDAPPEGPVLEDAEPHPRTHYGVYKLANEGTARTYWAQDGIPSIGLRPWVLFGVGRDQGLTSSPTKAMLAAALRVDFQISYSSSVQLQYAPDVARSFIAALSHMSGGARNYNIGGTAVSMSEVARLIVDAVPAMEGRITVAERTLPFPESFASSMRGELDTPAPTPLPDAIVRTVDLFKSLATAGRIGSTALG
jgi:nucleoside-diphosphate-sugar epimerase